MQTSARGVVGAVYNCNAATFSTPPVTNDDSAFHHLSPGQRRFNLLVFLSVRPSVATGPLKYLSQKLHVAAWAPQVGNPSPVSGDMDGATEDLPLVVSALLCVYKSSTDFHKTCLIHGRSSRRRRHRRKIWRRAGLVIVSQQIIR